MKRKINARYLQCKEAYLDGYKEGFSTAYHLGTDFVADFEDKHGWTPDCAYETKKVYDNLTSEQREKLFIEVLEEMVKKLKGDNK